MASIGGVGTGYGNQYLTADRLVQQQPAQMYDPQQYINPQQLAMMGYQNQAGYLQQSFNQQNPRMALPQNIGAAFGGAISQALKPQPTQQDQQAQQQDPTSQIQKDFTQRFQSILAGQSTPNYGSAMYQAATSIAADPQYKGSPVAQAIAMQYVSQAKEKLGYTPESEANTQASIAQKTASTADATEKLDQAKVAIQQQKDKSQYVPITWTPDPNTGITYAKQIGPYIPRYIDDNLTEDPNLQTKRQAAVAAGGANSDTITLDAFNASNANRAVYSGQVAAAKATATEQSRQQALANVDQDLANRNGKALYNGDMLLSDLSKSNSPTAQALYQASEKAAYAYADANGGTFSPTDMADRKKAESGWMSGSQNTQYSKLATVPRHLDDLEQIGTALQNGSFKPGNQLYNQWQRNLGAPSNVPSFDLAKQVFALELSGALNQRGGSDDDRKAITAQINNADGPQVLTKTLATEEKLWADKADDVRINYEQTVKGKRFLGDVVNPQQQPQYMEMYSKYYPVQIGAGDGNKAYFDKLPDSTTIQTPKGRIMKASDLRAMQGANSQDPSNP